MVETNWRKLVDFLEFFSSFRTFSVSSPHKIATWRRNRFFWKISNLFLKFRTTLKFWIKNGYFCKRKFQTNRRMLFFYNFTKYERNFFLNWLDLGNRTKLHEALHFIKTETIYWKFQDFDYFFIFIQHNFAVEILKQSVRTRQIPQEVCFIFSTV